MLRQIVESEMAFMSSWRYFNQWSRRVANKENFIGGVACIPNKVNHASDYLYYNMSQFNWRDTVNLFSKLTFRRF
jgi:hypothetical protein